MVEIVKIFSYKDFYLNWNLTDRIRTFPLPSSASYNLHKWLLLFHLNVFTLDNIFKIVCVFGGGGGAFWHNSSNVYDIIWIHCTYMYIFYWVESTDAASLITRLFCIIGHKTKVVWKELGGVVLGRPLFKIGFHVKTVKYMCNIGRNA